MKTQFTARKAVTLAAGAAMAVMAVPVVATPAMAEGNDATLVIQKVVNNPDGVHLDRRLDFTIAPNCNVGADPSPSPSPSVESRPVPNTITLGAGDHESLRVSNPGSCDPQEVAPSDTHDYHWLAPSYSSSTDGNTRTVTITNTVAGNGDLTITKSVVNADNVDVPKSFSVAYDCGFDYKHDKISGSGDIRTDLSLKVHDVPTGNVCTVTETAPTGAPADYSWSTVYSPKSFTMIHDGGTINVQNTISRDTGTLTITKVFNAGGATYTTPFTVFYGCSVTDTKPTAVIETTVTPGTPRVISGIPTHSVCLVTEPTPAAVAGYTWSTPVISGVPTAEMTTSGVAVTVTNALTAIPSGGGGGGAAAPAPAAVAVVTPSVTPSPVGVVPSASASEAPAPVNVALPAVGAKPASVNAGGGSAATDSSLPRWGFAFALLALVSICVVAVRMQGSKS